MKEKEDIQLGRQNLSLDYSFLGLDHLYLGLLLTFEDLAFLRSLALAHGVQ